MRRHGSSGAIGMEVDLRSHGYWVYVDGECKGLVTVGGDGRWTARHPRTKLSFSSTTFATRNRAATFIADFA